MPKYLKLLYLVVLFGCLGGSSFAVEGPRTELIYRSKARVKFDDRKHDFGDVKRGQKLTAEFHFTNTGTGPLVIQGVHASCGCTAVEADHRKIYEPGERGAIKVTFDTGNFLGDVTKSISVMTNEAAAPARTLTVVAKVAGQVIVNPPLVDFGDVETGIGAEQIVNIAPTDGLNLRVNKLDFNRRILDVGYVKEGSRWVLNVKLRPQQETGFIKESIVVKNNSELQSELVVPVRATVKGVIEHFPSYVEFGAIESTQTSSRTIEFVGAKDYKLTRVNSELVVNGKKVPQAEKFIEIIHDESDGLKKNLGLKLTNNLQESGSVHGRIVFETDSAHQKEVSIDFYAFFL